MKSYAYATALVAGGSLLVAAGCRHEVITTIIETPDAGASSSGSSGKTGKPGKTGSSSSGDGSSSGASSSGASSSGASSSGASSSGASSSGASSSGASSSGGTPGCPATGPFAPDIPKPVAPKQAGLCTPAKIQALATACVADPNAAACASARAGDPTCAGCIFSQKADPTWRVVILQPNDTPAARYNQEGCIDHATNVPGCGSKYMTIIECFNEYCGACGDDTSADACVQGVAAGECKDYRIADQACADALDAPAVDACFPTSQGQAGIEQLFKAMAALQCPQ